MQLEFRASRAFYYYSLIELCKIQKIITYLKSECIYRGGVPLCDPAEVFLINV